MVDVVLGSAQDDDCGTALLMMYRVRAGRRIEEPGTLDMVKQYVDRNLGTRR